MSEPAPLRVDLLGPPGFSWLGRKLAVDTRKALAVLAVLVAESSDRSGPVDRDRLAATFWPDVDERRARGALRRTLSVLVAATGNAVTADRTTVGLRPGVLESDIVRLRELSRSDDREDLARAVGLVRGEFMAGFRIRDCEPFDTWMATVSASLGRELGSMLERLVIARLRYGELHAGLADAIRWLELDPLHEPAHRSVMRLLAWTGRRQEALEQYRRCVRVLADELGVAPVRATTAVFDAIRTDTLAPPKQQRVKGSLALRSGDETRATAHHRVVLPMVGRELPLADLCAAAGRSGRLFLVTGESGVGRSRLMEEFASVSGPVLMSRAHEGEAALSFSPIPDLLRSAVAAVPALDTDVAVEISRVLPECLPPGREPPPPLDSLGARDRFFDAVVRTLGAADVRAIVVEDVHAASPAGAEVLSYVLHRLDRLRCPLVLTWRDPGLPVRHPVRLALSLGRLTERTASIALRRLVLEDVVALVAGSSLDAPAVFAATAGLPMLLVDAISSGRSDVLSVPARDVLAARLAEVSEETGQVLAALAVCGGVSDFAELRVTSGRGDLETVEAIEEALRYGLVREEGAGVAFTHDALRRVAYDQLSLARRRLLHLRAAEAVIDTELRSGQIAHHWHNAGRDERAVVAAWTAATRAVELFAHQEALEHLEFVIGLGGDRSEVALAQGDALVALGRYEQALAAFERAASLVGPDDFVVQARIERRSADVHARDGEWQLADEGLAAAVALLADADEDLLRSQLLADRAIVALRRGADPAPHVAAAVALTGRDVAYVHDVAGLVALATGDSAQAVAIFTSALGATTDVAQRTALLNNLAQAQAAAGSPQQALDTSRLALELGQAQGDRHRLGALHANLADRLHDVGEPEEAMRHLKAAAMLFAEVGADPLNRPHVWTLANW